MPATCNATCRDCHLVQLVEMSALTRRFRARCSECGGILDQGGKVRKPKNPVKLRRNERDKTCKRTPIRYDTYIRSRRWERKRQQAIRRANHRCEECGANSGLQVHHLTYKNLGREKRKDLKVLCVNCHRIAHDLLIEMDKEARSICQ